MDRLKPHRDQGCTVDGAQLLTCAEHGVEIELRHGVLPTSYENAHVVLSIGVAAGLHSDWESGAVMLPRQFTPFDIHNMAVMPALTYKCNNHLVEAMGAVLALQDSQLLHAINHQYASANPSKKSESANFLRAEDFRLASLLQVNGLFNPSTLPNSLSVLK
jgi:hypothetical protein